MVTLKCLSATAFRTPENKLLQLFAVIQRTKPVLRDQLKKQPNREFVELSPYLNCREKLFYED